MSRAIGSYILVSCVGLGIGPLPWILLALFLESFAITLGVKRSGVGASPTVGGAAPPNSMRDSASACTISYMALFNYDFETTTAVPTACFLQPRTHVGRLVVAPCGVFVLN